MQAQYAYLTVMLYPEVTVGNITRWPAMTRPAPGTAGEVEDGGEKVPAGAVTGDRHGM